MAFQGWRRGKGGKTQPEGSKRCNSKFMGSVREETQTMKWPQISEPPMGDKASALERMASFICKVRGGGVCQNAGKGREGRSAEGLRSGSGVSGGG